MSNKFWFSIANSCSGYWSMFAAPAPAQASCLPVWQSIWHLGSKTMDLQSSSRRLLLLKGPPPRKTWLCEECEEECPQDKHQRWRGDRMYDRNVQLPRYTRTLLYFLTGFLIMLIWLFDNPTKTINNPLNFTSDDQQNVYCLNSIINDNQKSETWLVFLVHGFMGSLDDGPYFDLLRESFLTRY